MLRPGLAAAATAALVLAAGARAGGDFADLAAGTSQVWLVGEPGLRVIDGAGTIVAAPQPRGAAYPLSVALAGGAAWVASVENGFGAGTLTRLDARTRARRVVWRSTSTPIEYVAAGAGGVWALVGTRRPRVVLFGLDGRVALVRRVPGAGRLAADRSGCWISTSTWLLHLDERGRLHRVVRATLGDVATGGGAAWLPQRSSLLRVDARTLRVRVLRTGPLRPGGFQHDLAVGAGAVWILDDGARARLVRLDPRSGRRTGSVRVPGIADAVAVRGNDVWVATAGAVHDVVRYDARTLRRTLLVHVG